MCKKAIKDLVEWTRLTAITDEQRALVVEACLGYYILNEPPEELVLVVQAVSQLFIESIKRSGVDAVAAISYIASTQGKFYGVLEEVPSTDMVAATDQVLRALGSSSIAVQLNVHRTLVKFVAGMNSQRVRPGITKRTRKLTGKSVPTDRYGAVGLMGGVELTPTTQVHVPASSQFTTEGEQHPFEMPAVSGPSGTTEVLLKVVKALGLSRSQQRWYCLGILGFLLAPGAHSLHEVALTVQTNDIAEYMPCYRYCGFLGFEMQKAAWYRPMLLSFGCSMRFKYWGDLEHICYLMVKNFPLPADLLTLVLSFIELPFLAPETWSPMLQGKLKEK